MSAAATGKSSELRTPTPAVSSLDNSIMTADGSPVGELKTGGGLVSLLTRVYTLPLDATKITQPLDRFSKLCYAATSVTPNPNDML